MLFEFNKIQYELKKKRIYKRNVALTPSLVVTGLKNVEWRSIMKVVCMRKTLICLSLL